MKQYQSIIEGPIEVTGSLNISGSIYLSGSLYATDITGSLFGTASYAETASYALNAGAGAGFPYSGSAVITGSLLVTEGITGSFSGSVYGYVPNEATTSFITNSQTSSFVVNDQTGSFVTNSQTSSFVVNDQTGSFVQNSQTSSFVQNSQTSSFVTNSQTSSFVTNSQTSSFVQNSQTSSFVQNSQTSSFVVNNQTASFATTGSNTFIGNQIITGSITFNSGSRITSTYYGNAYPGYIDIIAGAPDGFVELLSYNASSSFYIDDYGAYITANSSSQFNLWEFRNDGRLLAPRGIEAPSFTGSLFGTATTASYILQAVSASYSSASTSASYALSSTSASYASASTSASYALTASYVTASAIVGTITSASYAATSSYATVAANGGVTKILAGANVNISPVNGLGDVTVTSFGTNLYNTATGSYGSFFDTGSVLATSATAIYSMSLNTTDISNGVFISASNGDNTRIKFTNAGTYNVQFSSQFSNTDNSNQDVVIWVKKNGVDIPDSSGVVSVPPHKAGSNGQVISGWNYFLNLSANDYVQMCWHVEQANVITLETIPAGVGPTHPRTPSTILTANRVDTFLSNTGSFSGSFTGELIGTAQTASYILQAVSASFATTASYALNAGAGGASSQTGSFGAAWDGQGGTVTTGNTVYKINTVSGSIRGWNILATGTNPTCTIDVWKVAYGTSLPTVTNSITGSSTPALSTGNAIRSTTLTGWTTALTPGDIFAFNVNAVSAATKIFFNIEYL